jgi:hypothetical protein
MTAGLRIFEVKLPTIGALAAWRDFAERPHPYRLEVGDDTWLMSISDAARLGYSAVIIERRFRRAARTGNSVEVGQVFRRDDDAGLLAEIGIGDAATISVQLFNLPRVTLQAAESKQLLAGLLLLDADAGGIPGGHGGGLASKLAR